MAFLNSRFLCFRVLKQLNKYEYKGRTVIRQLNTRIFMSTLVGGTRGVLHKRVKDALSGAFQGTDIEVSDSLVMPTQPQHGDYQTNIAMTLTKKLGMKPKEIADKIVNALKVDDLVSVVNITGPGFITMRLSDTYVQSQILEKAKDKTRLGIAKLETPQRVIVDFSSPNIAKEMHVGHLRSTILGDSLSRILSFLGHDVLRLNHVGDWGTQFGMLIHYLKAKFPQQIATSTTTTTSSSSTNDASIELKLSVSDLMECYRAAKKCFDEDPLFKEEAKKEVVKLQGGDKGSLTVWNAICDKSREEFQKIYDILNIEINERGESFYNPFLAPLVTDLASKRVIVESQGSKCIFIPGDKYKTPEGEPLPLLMQKSDGGFLYATTDMAAVVHRTATEKADRILYVTDAGQAQHFAMVFDAARAYNLVPAAAQLHHVPFGLVLGEDGKKIKTRSGESVRLKELLEEAVNNAARDMSERFKKSKKFTSVDGTDAVAENISSDGAVAVVDADTDIDLTDEFKEISAKVGLASVKYADLSMNRLSDYRFSFKKMLSLTGNTAPYMLYAYVRIRGIQRKAELAVIGSSTVGSDDGYTVQLLTPDEIALGKQLLKLEETLVDVSLDYCPNKLCDYLFELSQKFNTFYEKCPVLKAETLEIQRSRTILCSLTADTLKLSLELLGIETVEKL